MTMTGKEAREMFRQIERRHQIKTFAIMAGIMVIGIAAIFAAGVIIAAGA
jgi:hypothetical protein